MSYADLPKEERAELWSKLGVAFDVYFGKIDVFLEAAKDKATNGKTGSESNFLQ